MTRHALVPVELAITLDPAYLTREVAEAALDGVPLRLEVRELYVSPVRYEGTRLGEPARLMLRLEGVSHLRPTLEPDKPDPNGAPVRGFCSHCGQDAARGPTGAWWHIGDSCWGVGHAKGVHFVEEHDARREAALRELTRLTEEAGLYGEGSS